MATDYSTLKEPVTWEDLIDQEEYMDSLAESVKTMFDRMRFQYQQDTWMSNELWAIYQEARGAVDRMSRLRQAMEAAGAISKET